MSFFCLCIYCQLVKRSAKEESRYPLMEEYDFKNDLVNPILNMDLRPSTRIRVRVQCNFCACRQTPAVDAHVLAVVA